MIEVVCGLPGAGKTYYLACEGLRAQKRGRPVWANFPLTGAYRLTVDDLRECVFPAGGLLLIDEAGLEFNSRDWASFDKAVFLLFTQHRKFGVDLLLAAQHPKRLDKVIREVAAWFWWAEPHLLWFSYSGYLSMEDFGLVRPVKVRYLLRRPSVFKAFDTYYVHAVSSRSREAPEDLWPVGGGASTCRGASRPAESRAEGRSEPLT